MPHLWWWEMTAKAREGVCTRLAVPSTHLQNTSKSFQFPLPYWNPLTQLPRAGRDKILFKMETSQYFWLAKNPTKKVTIRYVCAASSFFPFYKAMKDIKYRTSKDHMKRMSGSVKHKEGPTSQGQKFSNNKSVFRVLFFKCIERGKEFVVMFSSFMYICLSF